MSTSSKSQTYYGFTLTKTPEGWTVSVPANDWRATIVGTFPTLAAAKAAAKEGWLSA